MATLRTELECSFGGPKGPATTFDVEIDYTGSRDQIEITGFVIVDKKGAKRLAPDWLFRAMLDDLTETVRQYA